MTNPQQYLSAGKYHVSIYRYNKTVVLASLGYKFLTGWWRRNVTMPNVCDAKWAPVTSATVTFIAPILLCISCMCCLAVLQVAPGDHFDDVIADSATSTATAAGPAADLSHSNKQPTGRVIGIVKRNWRSRGMQQMSWTLQVMQQCDLYYILACFAELQDNLICVVALLCMLLIVSHSRGVSMSMDRYGRLC